MKLLFLNIEQPQWKVILKYSFHFSRNFHQLSLREIMLFWLLLFINILKKIMWNKSEWTINSTEKTEFIKIFKTFKTLLKQFKSMFEYLIYSYKTNKMIFEIISMKKQESILCFVQSI
jgi:hypothetical protein